MTIVAALEKKNFTKDEALYSITRNNRTFRDEKKSFDSIKNYIKSCPASNDPHSRIIIDNDGIYFGHGLMEIEASFPGLIPLIMTRPSKSFSEDNISTYFDFRHDSDFNILNPIKEKQKALIQEARDFFNSTETTTLPKKNLSQGLEPQEVLFNLIDSNNTVAVGELHGDKSSKKLLIDNMPQLKEKGIGAIYLEHVFYDTQKELFDAYFESDSLLMPEMLKNHLERLDLLFHLSDGKNFSPYTFTGLVIQAKRYDIRIIPVDTVASYSTGSALHIGNEGVKDAANRCLMMNYVAAKSYEEGKLPTEKSLFFVGSKHINSANSGIPGIAEITKGATLVVEDKSSKREKLAAEEHPAKPDVVIYLDTKLSREAKNLSRVYTKALVQQQNPNNETHQSNQEKPKQRYKGKTTKEEKIDTPDNIPQEQSNVEKEQRKQQIDTVEPEIAKILDTPDNIPQEQSNVEKEQRKQQIDAVEPEIAKILNNLAQKIGNLDQHHFSEAYGIAKDLLSNLQNEKQTYLKNLENLEISPQAANEKFRNRCNSLIDKAKPVLERDLKWGDYLSNIAITFANAIFWTFTFGKESNFFSPVRSESVKVVEEAQKQFTNNASVEVTLHLTESASGLAESLADAERGRFVELHEETSRSKEENAEYNQLLGRFSAEIMEHPERFITLAGGDAAQAEANPVNMESPTPDEHGDEEEDETTLEH